MKKACLIVLDGWGINPDKNGNAIALAKTPNLSRLFKEYPSTSIDTSGRSVGLPEGQMGNSEVGHLTMGAGRVVYQELTRISKAIENGEFFKNPELDALLDKVLSKNSSLHVMGLLSDGGVHSHITHLYAVLEAARKKGIPRVYVHAFLDGRDTPPSSGIGYMEQLLGFMNKIDTGRIATICGRYYAMDRDNRWERIEKEYRAMAEGKGTAASDPLDAVRQAYLKGETDEFVSPIVITPSASVQDNDGIIFFNFRADRAREITKAFMDDFAGFDRKVRPAISGFLCMTEYDQGYNLPVIFKPQSLDNILGEVLSRNGLKQFRVSETEKYAHVTFFFNGGREEPFTGEERVLVPSVRDVPTYDKKPQMRAIEIAEAAAEKIKNGDYSFILMNFANCDMVGHTGVLEAAIKASEYVDTGVGTVVSAALQKGFSVIITSDHGNAEQMIDLETGGPFTAHTINQVPFILVDNDLKGVSLRTGGGLEDIAPTVLKIIGIEKPKEMSGRPLF